MAAVLLFHLLPATAHSQGFPFSASLMIGLGGSLDESSEAGLDNLSWQAAFTYETVPQTHFGVRLGQVDLDGEAPSEFRDSQLTYLTAAGEYRFAADVGESGLYLGLGAYDLDGVSLPDGGDSGIGLVFGTTGDFQLNQRWSVLLELSAHYADIERAQFFLIAHGGVSFHF